MPVAIWIVLAFAAGAVFPLLGLLAGAGIIGYHIAIRGTAELNQLTDVEYVEKLVEQQRKQLR